MSARNRQPPGWRCTRVWAAVLAAAILVPARVAAQPAGTPPAAPPAGQVPAASPAAGSVASATVSDSLDPGSDAAFTAALDAALAAAESAWRAADVNTLLLAVGDQRVTLGGFGGDAGAYDSGRCGLILERLFATSVTQEFRFVSRRNAGQRTAVALADWSYRQRGDGGTRRDRVLVVLERVAVQAAVPADQALPRWRIVEIQIVQ